MAKIDDFPQIIGNGGGVRLRPPLTTTQPVDDVFESSFSILKAKLPGAPESFLRQLAKCRTVYPEIEQLLERGLGVVEAHMAGAYLNPFGRVDTDAMLTKFWKDFDPKPLMTGTARSTAVRERDVIVGGGLHAAIYAAVAYKRTGRKPVVVDNGSRVGGTFAMSCNPAFYLNSRNRPGPLGLPGQYDRPGSLNYLHGAPVQPAMLSSDEYADNASLGWAIRMSLACYADVITGHTVTEINAKGVVLDDGQYMIPCARVIVATGVGKPRRVGSVQSTPMVMSYNEFMASMDSPFPLKDLQRVAVIGSGDGANTVVEALTGKGPARAHMSLAGVDWVTRIDWYGPAPQTCASWRATTRSRYQGIGRDLPRESFVDGASGYTRFTRQGRVNIMGDIDGTPIRASSISVGSDEVMVNGIPYDRVILAAGFEPTSDIEQIADEKFTNSSIETVGSMQVGRKFTNGGVPYYIVGPAARLEMLDSERNALMVDIPENAVAIWRYARRTAALAEALNS